MFARTGYAHMLAYRPAQVPARSYEDIDILGGPGPAGPTTDRLGAGQDKRNLFLDQSLQQLTEVYGNNPRQTVPIFINVILVM